MTIPTNKYINRYYGQTGYMSGGNIRKYSAFNGYQSAPYLPNSSIAQATLQGTVTSAPAALSTMIINGPDGVPYTFQFVYTGGAAATVGIPITLPAGGGTAAQVHDAIIAAINLGTGIETDTGKRRYFPFNATTVSVAVFLLNSLRNGPFAAPAGTQATITWVNGSVSASAQAMPAKIGPLGAFQAGST